MKLTLWYSTIRVCVTIVFPRLATHLCLRNVSGGMSFFFLTWREKSGGGSEVEKILFVCFFGLERCRCRGRRGSVVLLVDSLVFYLYLLCSTAASGLTDFFSVRRAYRLVVVYGE